MIAERVAAGFSLTTLLVKDTLIAVGCIATKGREKFNLTVIGVTGSNGKTTVKEMIASILNTAFGQEKVLATAGNLNNEIGVPLTVFRLNEHHQAAVIELGMNHVGEIAYLSKIAQPNVALVNNAQREHQEFMRTVQAVAEENGAVILSLPEDGIAVFPSDDSYSFIWNRYAGKHHRITFGFTENPNITVTRSAQGQQQTLILTFDGQRYELVLATSGLHNVRNAMAAAACCFAIGISGDVIVNGLARFVPVKGRLEKKVAFNGAAIIDDTYNANPDSDSAVLNVLVELDR